MPLFIPKLKNFLQLRLEFWGLVTTAGIMATISTVLAFFGRLGWLLDLFSHFRVQYLLFLGTITLILLIGRRWKSALCFGFFAIINLSIVLPLYFGGRSIYANTTVPSLQAMLINVNTDYGDRVRIDNVVQQYDPDFVILEEINSQWLAELKTIMISYPYVTARPRDDNFGIALYSKFPFSKSDIVYIGSVEVPSIVAEFQTKNGVFILIATHPLPPTGKEYSYFRNEQLAELAKTIQEAAFPVLLLGDLNVSPWSHHFRRLLQSSGLEDSSKGRGIQPTWPSYNLLFRIPIDHCLHSPEIQILNKQIGPDVGSDHYPVIVNFLLSST